jgi:hypothetical protein
MKVNSQKRQLAHYWVSQSDRKMQQDYEEKADHRNYFNKVLVVRDIDNVKKHDLANQNRRHNQTLVRKYGEYQQQQKNESVLPWMHSGINKNSSVILQKKYENLGPANL